MKRCRKILKAKTKILEVEEEVEEDMEEAMVVVKTPAHIGLEEKEDEESPTKEVLPRLNLQRHGEEVVVAGVIIHGEEVEGIQTE